MPGEPGSAAVRTVDRALGVAVAAAALAFWLWVIPAHTSASDTGWLRPRTLPVACAAALVGLGLVQAALPGGRAAPEWRQAGRAAGLLLLAATALWAMTRVGFLATAPAFVLALMLCAGERRWPWLAAGTIGTPALIWVVVDVLLARSLP